MNTDELEYRIRRLEEVSGDIQSNHENIDKTLTTLNTTLALLNQTVQNIIKREDDRKAMNNKIFTFVIGGIITAILAWILRGGLIS